MASTTTKQLPARQNSHDRPPVLSRSASVNSTHTQQLRPKSRASSTSLQSVGVGNSFQPVQPSHQHHTSLDQAAYFLPDGTQQTQGYPPPPNMEDPNVMGYQQNMQQIRPHPQMIQQHDMRPMSQHGYPMQPMQVQYADALQGYGMPTQHMHHMRHASEQYEGSPAPEDSNNEGNGKRRKGTASSMANDQELRRLLLQYNGRTLKEVANEVQKNEGAGGKSEKAKQVFAMLWLRENVSKKYQLGQARPRIRQIYRAVWQ